MEFEQFWIKGKKSGDRKFYSISLSKKKKTQKKVCQKIFFYVLFRSCVFVVTAGKTTLKEPLALRSATQYNKLDWMILQRYYKKVNCIVTTKFVSKSFWHMILIMMTNDKSFWQMPLLIPLEVE